MSEEKRSSAGDERNEEGLIMNILTQSCGIVLLMVILVFYNRQTRVRLKTSLVFSLALYVTILCLCFDILSIVVINYMSELPGLLVEIVCKTYLVTFVGIAICSIMYVYVDIFESDRKKYRYSLIAYAFIGTIGIILIYTLPIHYKYSDNVVIYTYGPSVVTTYGVAVLFVISTLVTAIRNKNKMNPRRREAVILWMLFWFAAAIIQFLNNKLLIVGYACAIGVMIVYIMLENPEVNLDKRTGLFNQSALFQYLRQFYSNGQGFSAVVFIMEHSFKSAIQEEEKDFRFAIAQYLINISDAFAFKMDEDEIVLIFNDSMMVESAIAEIQKYAHLYSIQNLNREMTLKWMCIMDNRVVEGESEFFYLIKYVRQNNKEYIENGNVYINEKIVAEMKSRREVENIIIDAIENERIEVFYQPIYSNNDRMFTAAEALVRIRDENGNIIPPGVFIDISEENGMILRLGEIVFEHVCEFLEENDLRKYGFHYIEVNLSVVQCAYQQLADEYIDIMKKHNISPDLINLEITESASISAKKTMLDNMTKLIDYGVRFSLDDFGTGQSNLNYIIDMPVDIVKFDRTMSMAYFENGKGKFVMDAAMHMIQGMELKIVSEGIETKEQYLEMKRLGIDYIQGYYFSKPLPGMEFLEFIRKNAVKVMEN